MLLETATLYESDSKSVAEQKKNFESISGSDAMSSHIHLPWEKFLTESKKKDRKNLSYITPARFLSLKRGNIGLFKLQATDNELPGSVCAGGAEMLAGALICILGPIFPPAWAVGGALIMDGFSRVVTGLDEMDQRPSPGP